MERASLKRRRARGVTSIKAEPVDSSQPTVAAASNALPAHDAPAAVRVNAPAAHVTATHAARVTPPANMSDTDATRCTDSENEYQARKRARGLGDKSARDRAQAGVRTVGIVQVRPAPNAADPQPRINLKRESSDNLRASSAWNLNTNQHDDKAPENNSLTLAVDRPRHKRIYSRWTQLKGIKDELETVKTQTLSAMDKIEKMIDDECREWLNLA